MGILKTLTRHEGSSVDLEKYLNDPKNGNERALAMDWNGTVRDPDNWGKEFDEVRKYWNKDSGITLRHFIISPDPEAHVTLKQLRKLAIKWAEKNFKDGQWVIVYHDDNENHILHAHVVLNWVRLDGRKWRIDDKEYANIANDVHSMAREMGLYCGLHDVGRGSNHEIQSWNKKTQAEEALKKRDAWSWKREIQYAVQQCAPKSTSFEDFQKNLKTYYGVTATINSRGGITYTHPLHQGENNHRYMVRDSKLGAGYSTESIERMLFADAMKLMQDTGEFDEKAFSLRIRRETKELEFARPKMWLPKPKNTYERVYRTSRRTGLANIEAISKAITTIHQFAIKEGMGDNINFKQLMDTYRNRLAQCEREVAKTKTEYNAAGEILSNIRAYNKTLDVYEEFKNRSVLTKGRYQKEHESEIAAHETALSWFKDNHIDVGEGIIDENKSSRTRRDAEIKYSRVQSEYENAKKDLELLQNSGRTLYKQQTRPRLRVPHDGGVVQGSGKPVNTRLNLNGPFYQQSTVRHGKRIKSTSALQRTTVTVSVKATMEKPPVGNKQSADAIASALKREENERRQAALMHELTIDKRIRKEDEDLKERRKQAEKEGKNIEDVLLKPLKEQKRMMKFGRDPRKWKELGYYDEEQNIEKKLKKKHEHTIANVCTSARERAAAQGKEGNQLIERSSKQLVKKAPRI